MAGGTIDFAKIVEDLRSPAAIAAVRELGAGVDSTSESLRRMSASVIQVARDEAVLASAAKQAAAAMGGSEVEIESASKAAVAALRDQRRATETAAQAAQAAAHKYGSFSGIFKLFRENVAHGRPPLENVAGALRHWLNPASLAIGATVGAAAALAALGAAAVATGISLARLALTSADAARSYQLHLDGLVTLRTAYVTTAGSASELAQSIAEVSDASALSRGEVQGMAEQLYRAGLRGQNLRDALEGLSIAQSVQGDRGAERFRTMAVSLRGSRDGVRRLADEYRQRLGPIAERQALSLDRQASRMQESIGAIFATVRIEGFLRGMRSVLDLLSQSTASGRALRQIAEVMLSPFFDELGSDAPIAVRFFQGLIISAQDLTIQYLTLRNALHRVISPDQIEGLRSIFAEGAGVAGQSAGTALMNGFRIGIETMFPQIGPLMTSLASAAAAGLSGALEIRSPSRVFARLGAQVPRGFGAGVDAGLGEAERAGAAVGDAAVGGSRQVVEPVQRGALGGGQRPSIIANITITGATAEAGRQAARAFLDELGSALEGYAIEVGGLPT